MVLADTSVWIAHFRAAQPGFEDMLSDGLILMHPFVVGELACGNLKNRARILDDLKALPRAKRASDEEVMYLIQDRNLSGRGLGWTDAHLLAAALLSRSVFWTVDKRLAAAASDLGLT